MVDGADIEGSGFGVGDEPSRAWILRGVVVAQGVAGASQQGH